MADAVFAIPSFLGGEISKFAQGRFDKPDYRISMNVCRNSFPVEIGAWTRRPGTKHAGTTRGGLAGRVMKFDFEQAAAYTMEFTDGFVRFRAGERMAVTDDARSVVSISTADPAVVQTDAAHGWADEETVLFGGDGVPTLLQSRTFVITVTSTTEFSLQDSVTLETIDGSTLSALGAATVSRVQELETPYAAGSWSSIRSIQAETDAVLLNRATAPQVLQATELPTSTVDAQFAIDELIFLDGPYLDPFTNGVQAVPSALSGLVSITLQFPLYSATKAYKVGDFVTSSGVNYVSLADVNIGHTPVSEPTYWEATSAGTAIAPNGFVGSDVGRLVRLYSQPADWDVSTLYNVLNIVTYNNQQWTALANSTGKIPGNDLTNWTLTPSNGAVWTWGRIVSLTNQIPQATGPAIGNMTFWAGLAASFDGVTNKTGVNSSAEIGPNLTTSLVSYIGKNFSASPQQIAQATIYPSSNFGFYYLGAGVGHVTTTIPANVFFTLYGSQTAPVGPLDGTQLAISSVLDYPTSAITLVSSDQVTSWNYLWVTITVQATQALDPTLTASLIETFSSQLYFFGPATSLPSSAGINVEILGPPLLYSQPVVTWRLGVYSDTTGWPTCGTYQEGRIWLGGAVANRFDASKSNGLVGNTVDFAPTDNTGVVAANNAISYVLNSDGVNPMYWMKPDLQGVVIGTQNGEWLVQAPTAGPITPTNIAARRMTKHGSENIDPVRTQHANLFVKRYARKLMEYFADAYSGKFSAPNLADKAEHIISAGIAEIAYTEAVTPIVWGRDADGALFGMTYKRDNLSAAQPPDYYAWHPHTLGSGRILESLCSGPSVGGDLDALTMVTNDPDTGIRHVEILTDAPDENAALADAWFLDNAIEPYSTSSSSVPAVGAPLGGLTINGLWHLNGETVQVFASGLDCGDRGDNSQTFTDFLVTNGSVLVPYGDGLSAGSGRGLFTATFAATANIVVGFTYNSDGQLVRSIAPADSGSRTGPALGLTRRNHRYAMLLCSTRGISVGATFTKLYPVRMQQANGAPIATLDMFSGIADDVLSNDYSMDGMICWRVSRPFPANLVAISASLQTQGR